MLKENDLRAIFTLEIYQLKSKSMEQELASVTLLSLGLDTHLGTLYLNKFIRYLRMKLKNFYTANPNG